jgi:hypothetical protein
MSCLPDLDQLPIEILESRKSVLWNFETRDGRPTKVPYQPHRPNTKASTTNPATWGRFNDAFDAVSSGKADGVGVVLGDGFIGIDIDHCRNAETGEIAADALALIRTLDSYTEISPSGTGVHIWVRGACPPGGLHRHGVELYSQGRYFTITGHHLPGTPSAIHDRTAQVTDLHAQLAGGKSSSPASSSSSSSARVVPTTSLDDAELLATARRANNGGAFDRLWSGDTSAYDGDDSAADLALLNHLAFYTGRDPERMDRLFRQSGLMRAKWDSRRRHSTYGGITTAQAIAGCTEVYEPAGDPEIDDSPEPEPESTSEPESPTRHDGWPTLRDDARVGLFGDLVNVLAPATEADPVALLIHLLVFFGSLLGRAARMPIGADLHYTNENALCVGDTALGRKGMACAVSRQVMADVDPIWAEGCVATGLSSGEGLIHAVRDATTKQEAVKVGTRVRGYETVTVDAGVTDKRLAVIEPEFGKVLRVSRRDGNTLSAVIRQAWDHGSLRVLTRQSPVKATNAHISIIGHCTPLELRQELRTTDMASGFANRFLIALVRRSQCLPDGGTVDPRARAELVTRFQAVAAQAEQIDTITRDDEARTHWHAIYPPLTRARAGLIGAVCNRAPAHVARLSCLYALAEASPVIRLEHQKAALAVWTYCETSATKLFGLRTGQRLADFLLALLRVSPKGLTRTQLSDKCGRNRRAEEINEALQLLVDYGLAHCKKDAVQAKPGRPAWRWFATAMETNGTS